jgi:hypothetical protein
MLLQNMRGSTNTGRTTDAPEWLPGIATILTDSGAAFFTVAFMGLIEPGGAQPEETGLSYLPLAAP